MKNILSLIVRAKQPSNDVTYWERQRFAKSMAGETATASAARLGCIAG